MKCFLLGLLITFAIVSTNAQMTVPPCPEPGTSIELAPLVDCCLDGYTYATTFPQGVFPAPPPFCGFIDNPQYLAFVATFTSVSLIITPENCFGTPMGSGLQAEIYGIGENCDINALYSASNCNSPDLQSPLLINAPNLELGHVYYLLIDGWAGDICDYSIEILETSNDANTGLNGPVTVTAGQTATYTFGYDFDIHNPCENIKMDTLMCQDTCHIIPTTISWTAPNDATILVNSNGLSAEVTFGETSGYVCINFETTCGPFEDCIFVQVLSPDCNMPLSPGNECASAVAFCDGFLSGFCSSTQGFTADTSGNLLELLDCSIENNQWLTFVPCSESVVLNFFVDDCQYSNGLEVAVLQTNDCETFIGGNQCQSILPNIPLAVTFSNLNIGEIYYLMVDGINGDVCRWEILTTEGISDGPVFQEENTPGYIIGADTACFDVPLEFTLIPPDCQLIPVGNTDCPFAVQQFCEGAEINPSDYQVEYDTVWHISPEEGWEWVNNDNSGTSVTVIFSFENTLPEVDYEISAQIIPSIPFVADSLANTCAALCAEILPDVEVCEIESHAVLITLINPIIEEVFTLCPGDTINYLGNILTEADFYIFEIPNDFDCIEYHFVTVEEESTPPTIAISEISCGVANLFYQVEITISGVTNGCFVNGVFLTGNVFLSNPIPSGQSYFFEISFVEDCFETQIIEGVYECPCLTDAGTIDTQIFQTCELQSVDSQHNNDELLDEDDVLMFILQDAQGTIINQNNSGIFTFQSGLMSYGESYWICALAGNDDGTGHVDLNDVCLSISDCKEVIFYEEMTGNIDQSNDLTCENLQCNLLTYINGGSGQFLYNWQGVNGFSSNTDNPMVMATGSYFLEVIDEATGCDLNLVVDVSSNFGIAEISGIITEIIDCNNPFSDVQMITSPLSTDDIWEVHYQNQMIESGIGSIPNLEFSEGGNYLLTITNTVSNCTVEQIFAIEAVNNLPTYIQLNIISPSCVGLDDGAIQVVEVEGGTAPFVFALNNHDFSTETNFQNLPPGEYELIAEDVNGCLIFTTVFLNNPEVPEISLGDDLEILAGELISFETITNVENPSFEWLINGQVVSDSLLNNFRPIQNAVVTVTVFNENDCTASDEINISVLIQEGLFAPNVFSPNGDGQNDYFTIYSHAGTVAKIKQLLIFDRWGDLVFKNVNFPINDEKIGWDGRNRKGIPLKSQILAYFVEVEMLDGSIVFLKGDLMLMR